MTILVVGLLLWFVPVLVAGALFARHSVFGEQGLFFSGAAVVTFGGAYAVLAYVAQLRVAVLGMVRRLGRCWEGNATAGRRLPMRLLGVSL